MYTTLQALISIVKEFDESSFESKKKLISSQTTDSSTTDLQYYARTKNLQKMFGEAKSQICGLSEILGPRTPETIGLKIMEYGDFTWRSTSLLSEKAERIITAKVYVFSYSKLCQSEVTDPSTANDAWKKKIELYGKNNLLKDLNGIDGMQTEFEWKIFPGFTTLGILEEIQKIMKSFQCELEEFEGRIIFVSMFDDIMWGENDNTEESALNAKEVSKYARRFPRGHWSFLGPGQEKTWYKTCSDKPNREWERTAAMMSTQFFEHPVPLKEES